MSTNPTQNSDTVVSSLQDSEQQKFYEDLVDLKVGSLSPRIDGMVIPWRVDPYIKFYPLAHCIFNSLI